MIDLEGHRDMLRKMPPHERPVGTLERVEAAHAKLALEHADLMKPGVAARAESVKKSEATGGLAHAQRLATAIQKSDPSMSGSEAFAEAMRDPEIAKSYIEENGGRVGGRVGIAKARQPGSHADIELKAEAIAKAEGLSGSQAYIRALQDLSPEQYAAGLAA
ncbi:MAG: hypothetical protein WA484_10295 [Solirubrobacteraceae bacterium]